MPIKFILVYLGVVLVLCLVSKVIKYFKRENIIETNEIIEETTKSKFSFKKINKESKKVEVESIKRDLNESDLDFRDFKNLNDFNYDNKRILDEFLRVMDDTKNSDFCIKLRNNFTSDVIYKLKTSNNMNEDIKVILNPRELKIYEGYKSINDAFILDDFINYLDELVKINDKKVTLFVTDKDIDDYTNYNVLTLVDEDIYKGIKIEYKGKLYDFSMSERGL